MIMFEKFGQHQPLNRQADRYALEGVPIALSTRADAVGAVCASRDTLLRLGEAHVMAAERLHPDDTTEPVLAKGKTDNAAAGSTSGTKGRLEARTRRGDVLLLARPQGRASPGASGSICRHPAGRRL